MSATSVSAEHKSEAAVVAGRGEDVAQDPTPGVGDRLRGLLGKRALRPGA